MRDKYPKNPGSGRVGINCGKLPKIEGSGIAAINWGGEKMQAIWVQDAALMLFVRLIAHYTHGLPYLHIFAYEPISQISVFDLVMI